MDARPADFAGTWYPGTGRECRAAIQSFLDPALSCPEHAEKVLGGIVPHAGWAFSGKIACNVIKCLAESESAGWTVLIFGHHMRARNPNLIMKEGSWETPLGPLQIDAEIAALLTEAFSFEVESSARYLQDNTIELQLPFIKYFLPEARILPMGLPPGEESLIIAERAVEYSNQLQRKVKVLGSTDLTHYGPGYGFMPKGTGQSAVEWVKEDNDRAVIEDMLHLDPRKVIREGLDKQNACCSGAAAAAIAASKSLGAHRAQELAYMTSYDVRPDHNFVGYVGILYYS